MNLIMKDLKTHLHKEQRQDVIGKLATFVLMCLLIIVLALEYSPAAAQEDLMISPDMASFIEQYHATIDEYGVE